VNNDTDMMAIFIQMAPKEQEQVIC